MVVSEVMEGKGAAEGGLDAIGEEVGDRMLEAEAVEDMERIEAEEDLEEVVAEEDLEETEEIEEGTEGKSVEALETTTRHRRRAEKEVTAVDDELALLADTDPNESTGGQVNDWAPILRIV